MSPQFSHTVQIASFLIVMIVAMALPTVIGGVAAAPSPDDGPTVGGATDAPTSGNNTDVSSIGDHTETSTTNEEDHTETSTTNEDTDTNITEGETEETTSTSTTPHDSCSVNPPYFLCFPPGPVAFIGNCVPFDDYTVEYGVCAAYYDGTRTVGGGTTVGAVDSNHGSQASADTGAECGGDSRDEIDAGVFLYVSPSSHQIDHSTHSDDPFELINECTP